MTLKTFFGHDIDFSKAATMFSIHHVIYVLSGIITISLILRYAKQIKASNHETLIKRIIVGLLLALEVAYHIHNWTYPRFSIPLHICSFAVFMSIYVLLTDSKRVFKYLFFFGTLGGIMALTFPNSLGYTYLNFRYYHFLLLHNILIAVPLYYYRAYDYRINYKTLLVVFRSVLILGFFVDIINMTLLHFGIDSNYWFITYIPLVMAPYFTSYPLYILTFIVAVFTSMNILYFTTHTEAIPMVYKKITR